MFDAEEMNTSFIMFQVTVQKEKRLVPLPRVFLWPIRYDLIRFARTVVVSAHLTITNFRPLVQVCSHPNAEKSSSALRFQPSGWTQSQRRVMGHRSSGGPYPPCLRWWHAPIWSRCIWQHVPWRAHVFSHQGYPPASIVQAV